MGITWGCSSCCRSERWSRARRRVRPAGRLRALPRARGRLRSVAAGSTSPGRLVPSYGVSMTLNVVCNRLPGRGEEREATGPEGGVADALLQSGVRKSDVTGARVLESGFGQIPPGRRVRALPPRVAIPLAFPP